MSASPSDPHPRSAGLAAESIGSLISRLASGETTSVELVSSLLERIEALDRSGPAIRSLVALDERALEGAEAADAARDSGAPLGPLHGIPLAVKDNIETSELATTAGSLALSSQASAPLADAEVVRRLRAAGAIVLAKSNLSEWANFRSTQSSSGWSATGGQTRNPFALDRSPGGSSSGSGAALAARLVPGALGTETDGSILCPAAFAGVVGLKPTLGLVPTDGVVPIAPSQDCVGPMARCVADVARLLEVLTGRSGYLDALDPAALSRSRIGFVRGRLAGYHRGADVLVEAAMETARAAGAHVVDDVEIESAAELDESPDELTVLSYEFHDAIDAYLRSRPGGPSACPRSLAELVAFNEANARGELVHFGQEIFELALETGSLADTRYLTALEENRRRGRERGIDGALGRAGCDVLAVLTMGTPWCIDQIGGDPDARAGYSVAAVAGYPSISLPIGTVGPLPVGLSLLGRPHAERTLLSVAAALEGALALETAPGYLETVPLS